MTLVVSRLTMIAIMTLLGLLTLTSRSSASKVSSGQDDSPTATHEGLDDNLLDLLKHQKSHQPELYSKALSILSSIGSTPSCSRFATSALLDSCASLERPIRPDDDSTDTVESLLDEVKSIYAARLAVCELTGAGVPSPSECNGLMPAETSKWRHRFISFLGREDRSKSPGGDTSSPDGMAQKQLGRCLRLLEGRPQWWTSYSNARQNAFVMCQAVRSEMDRDDLLKLHKSLTGVTSDLSGILSETIHSSTAHLKDQQSFATSLRAFQEQVLQDLDRTSVKSQGLFSRFAQELERSLHGVFASVKIAGQAAEGDVEKLVKNIRRSSSEAESFTSSLANFFQETLRGSSDLAAAQKQEWEVSLELAAGVKQSLEVVQGREIQELLAAFGNLRNELELSNKIVSLMHQKQFQLDERVNSLDTAFQQLEVKADAFHNTQSRQAETQVRLHEALKTDMHLVHGLVERATSKALDLQFTVDETSERIKQMGLLSGLGIFMGSWGWLLMVIIGLGMINKPLAGCIAVAAGSVYAISASGLLETTQHAAKPIIPALVAIGNYSKPLQAAQSRVMIALIISCVIAIYLLISCGFRRHRARSYNYLSTGREGSFTPSESPLKDDSLMDVAMC